MYKQENYQNENYKEKEEFYSEDSLNELLEEDSISSQEHAFMVGYVNSY